MCWGDHGALSLWATENNPPALISYILGLQMCTTTPGSCLGLKPPFGKEHKRPLEELLHLHFRCSSAPRGFSWLLPSLLLLGHGKA